MGTWKTLVTKSYDLTTVKLEWRYMVGFTIAIGAIILMYKGGQWVASNVERLFGQATQKSKSLL